MAWNEDRARKRIRDFMDSVPEGDIKVEDFRTFLTEARVRKGMLTDMSVRAALVDIPRNRAITTDAVHVYANLVDFNDVLNEAGRETEASHRRALEFLHAHYRGCDELIDEFEMQRVDFHGSRLHAVVLAPDGAENEGERVRVAVAFAAAFREMVERLGDKYPNFKTGVRIGIDSGPAVAIDSGRSDEREPLFIGSPANHAAKLADGNEEGLNLSPRAAAALGQTSDPLAKSVYLNEDIERRYLGDEVVTAGMRQSGSARLEKAYAAVLESLDARMKSETGEAVFRFHHKEPPLKDLVYADHPPSNAIRMDLVSIFADIDNFTAYIDNAIATGMIAEAVANLHVIRAEMGAVLRDDFGGRKVRYIGDCIHGLLAVGDKTETNAMDTMKTAVDAAAGLRSSFELCREMLAGTDELGLAIGIDYGVTPICRLGLRGDASVRAAASRATCVSEAEQRRCNGIETALGEGAYKASPASIREAFGDERVIQNLNVDTAEVVLGTMPSPYTSAGAEAEPMRAHEPEAAPPMRAHNLR
ncbi:adenylate/guanylate cyclase domain-containing protein [Oricola nitratireducens]|uniref:adenylate/guanylate cyclase domain-containing protein n=1 Tax=Oricola nitratireducens TaxID=2775868 RepID=UPI0018682CE1|nr:adenylate/guanylate cyclase domain-containing protein [Oricola nitratireducens]